MLTFPQGCRRQGKVVCKLQHLFIVAYITQDLMSGRERKICHIQRKVLIFNNF